jgi:hypothetical protein
MSGRFQFESENRIGPCLNGCGRIASYELVIPDPRRWLARCPDCDTYDAYDDQVEDICDPNEITDVVA